MISPMKDEMLNVVPVISSARKTPEVESSAEARIAAGAANVPNSNSSTVNTRTTASPSTSARSRNDFCCSCVGAAVDHANRRRNFHVGHDLLHHFHPLAQAHALESPGDRDVALQILAEDFGLPRFVCKFGQRSERRRSFRWSCW